MIYKRKSNAYRHQVRGLAGGDKATADSVLEVLFPYDDCGSFKIEHWDDIYNKDVTKTLWQRLNCIWVYPVFVLFVLPIQWAWKGSAGFDERTKIGRIVLKLIGEK